MSADGNECGKEIFDESLPRFKEQSATTESRSFRGASSSRCHPERRAREHGRFAGLNGLPFLYLMKSGNLEGSGVKVSSKMILGREE